MKQPLTNADTTTYIALFVVQAVHLFHHRLAKRHISFAEVISAVVLCVPPWAPLPALLLMAAHLSLIVVQVVGSLWIKSSRRNGEIAFEHQLK